MLPLRGRAYDLPPSEIESWVEVGRKGMEDALKANPPDVREQYERQLKDLQEAYGEAMRELRAREKLQSPAGRGREVIETIRQGLQADGITVSISKLCRWFDVPGAPFTTGASRPPQNCKSTWSPRSKP